MGIGTTSPGSKLEVAGAIAATGTASNNTSIMGTYAKDFVVHAEGLDTTIAIVLTFDGPGAYIGNIVEIFAAMSNGPGATNMNCIVRYSFVLLSGGNPGVVDLTHDLNGVTESVGVAANVATVTLTAPANIGYATIYVKSIGGYSTGVLSSVTAS